MTLIDVLIIILIVAAVVLCVYLVFTLNKLRKSFESIENDIHIISEKTVPVLDNLEEITRKAAQITGDAEEQISELKSFIHSIKRKVNRVVDLPGKINPEHRVSELLKNLNAVAKGFSVFWSKLFS
ncbi:MAG: DUF948 domain-containing protein [Bacteroidetes bacterium]|nr:DUF948 domain-containing protein [Bacteroidota bacterium]